MTDHSLIIQDDDDDICEEWEGHMALHDDVDNQERTEERTFESEKEINIDLSLKILL